MKWLLLIATLLFLLPSCYRDKAAQPAVGVNICTDSSANDTIHFATQIKPIMDTYCNSPSFGNCHQAGSSNGDFTGYEGLRQYADAGGELYNRVIVRKDMPSPSTIGPTSLTPCELAFIRNWVSQGALNN